MAYDSFGQIFQRHALSAPERPALVLRGRTYTYGEINAWASRWATLMLADLGGRPRRLGVFASRSIVSYVGVLAAVYAGAAFVPLNPRFPPDRTRRMAELAELDAILLDPLAARQPEALPSGVALYPPESLERETSGCPTLSPAEFDPDSLAYLLFTSGSTGLPKGVPITHGNLRAYLQWAHNRYTFRPEDRFSQTFDQTFDLSIHDLFLCWESGACLCPLMPAELLAPGRLIQREQLTVWFSVPSVVAQMRKRGTLRPGSFPSLRWSLFCGEPLPQASAEAWQAAAPNSIVENLYGPTELTIACSVHRWEPETSPSLCRNGSVPIGRLFPGLTPSIMHGELCVGGPQVSPGYWRNPEKTNEAFLDLPDGRFYRTGDRVEILPNGEFACLGRMDHQIKLLGFRVELGEIEAVLVGSPSVVQAAATGWPVVEGSAQGIVAFVSGNNADPVLLKAHCTAQLPDYMVPSEILVLPDLPLNANGKIDRPALQEFLRRRGA